MLGLFNRKNWWDKKPSHTEPEIKSDEYLNFGYRTNKVLSDLLSQSVRLMNDQTVTHSPRQKAIWKELNVALRDAIAAANDIHNTIVEG
jgi:hypothetical protein